MHPTKVPPIVPRLVLLALLALALPTVAFASASPDWQQRQREARLLAPAVGERAVESALQFVFELPKGAREAQLLVSRRAFDPAGWSAVESRPDLIVLDASRGAIGFEQAGVIVDSDTPLWWALAWHDPATGQLRFSEVRRFTAMKKFANRIAASPVVLRETRGRLDEADVAPRRAAAAKGQAVPSRPQVHLAAGYDFVPGVDKVAVPEKLSRVLRTPEDGVDPVGAYIVQFDDPPGDAERNAIADAGGVIVSYVPDQAFLVRMPASSVEKLSLARADVAQADYLPAYKLSPLADVTSPGTQVFDVRLFDDADVARARRDLVALGATDLTISDNGVNHIARFTLDRSQAAAVATLASVQWVEPKQQYTVDNSNVQWVVQTGISANRHVWDMGIRGSGQVVMTTDSGIRADHLQFIDATVPITTWGDFPTHRKIIAYYKGAPYPEVEFGDHAGASYHGTHTAGTTAGSDDPAGGTSANDGVAKDAKIWFEDLSGTALANGIATPADLNDLFQPGYTGNAGGAARLATNSWGSAVSGAYTLNSQQVDQFMWNHPDFLIDFSTGNSSLAGTVGSPATAKNSGGVGGTGNGTSQNTIYSSTSRGPCADGRRKPTFCSPGNGVTSASGAGTTGYQSLSGTSMACPGTTGAIALIRQYLTQGWYPTGAAVPANGFSPSAALMKAMAMNSATDSVGSFKGPDNNIGWGRVCVDSVLYFAGDTRRLVLVDHTQGLVQGDYVEYQVRLTNSLIPLKVSLCWTDYPGNPAVSRQLVNDLDLTVTDGTRTFLGNVITARRSVTGGSRDSLNVEEGVRIPMPGTGVYTIRVSAKSIPVGPQPFALVVTGPLAVGGGTLALDRTLYPATGTVLVQVTDPDAAGPLTVDVASTTEGTPEAVTLTGANGIFNGSFTLNSAAPTVDGELSVSNGDQITASYVDATYAATLTTQAMVNIDAPIITNVRATSQGVAGTMISWTTDRNANSRVYWGTTPALELGLVSASEYATSHSIVLSPLTTGQTYYYDVESVALTGGSARDDLGGSHHLFTAKAQGDVLLVLGDPGFARLGVWTTALSTLGFDYDVWSGSSADNPSLGDLTSGLRSYKAVLWQAGKDAYPAFSTTQQAAFDSLVGGGGRVMVIGHDIGWGMCDATSPGYSAANAAWVLNSLKMKYKADPTLISSFTGIAGDVISGPNTGGVTYDAWGTSGQSGDEIGIPVDASVTFAPVWRDNTPDTTTLRWESVAPKGSNATAYWGGQTTRALVYFHEWSGMVSPNGTPDTSRNGILDRGIQWLLGRQRPLLTVTSPNGGETITTASFDVTWNETAGPGRSIAARTIQYSLDGGDSWITLTTSAGPSPYNWNAAGVPNSPAVLLRVRVTDDGTPALGALDVTNATFALQRAGEDTQGPVVVAGSIQSSPNPINTGQPATLHVIASDASTGGSTVGAAEYSIGVAPAAAGTGLAMTSTFDSVTVHASAALNTNAIYTGNQTFWVRARDASGNWGGASSAVVRVNGTDPSGVGDMPKITFLAPSAPNPSAGPLQMRFGLAKSSGTDLAIFDAAGRKVRTVTSGLLAAGTYSVAWDGRDASGHSAAPGLYFVRLKTDQGTYEHRIVRLN